MDMDAAASQRDVLLTDFAPRPMLVVARHDVPRALPGHRRP